MELPADRCEPIDHALKPRPVGRSVSVEPHTVVDYLELESAVSVPEAERRP
jgi:hypothetical protein